MKKLILALFFVSSCASAQVYVSVSTGIVNYSAAKTTFSQSSDVSYGGAVGYQLNKYFSVETGFSKDGSYAYKGNHTTIDEEFIAGFFSIPIRKDFFGLIGGGIVVSQSNGSKGSNSFVSPAAGFGVGYKITDHVDVTLSSSDTGLRFINSNIKSNTISYTTGLRYIF